MLDDSNCETQYEADLTSDMWMDYQEKKRTRNHEGFKIILDLATQIDQLKIDLEREIQLVDELKVSFSFGLIQLFICRSHFRWNQKQRAKN